MSGPGLFFDMCDRSARQPTRVYDLSKLSLILVHYETAFAYQNESLTICGNDSEQQCGASVEGPQTKKKTSLSPLITKFSQSLN